MNLTVLYHGQIGTVVGCERELLDCPEAATLQQLLQVLTDRHGKALRRFLFNHRDQPSKSVLITVNNTMVDSESDPALHAEDEVALLPPIAGG